VVPNPNPFEVADPGGDTAFRPMKGPMTTQSLRGLANHGPLHWRGDRFGPAPHDEIAAFEQFNGAFVSLLGRSAPLSDEEMHAFAEFALQITYPPNPIRNLDDTLTPAQADGRMIYQGLVSDGVRTCDGCHVLDRAAGFFGTDGDSSFDREPQDFKIPHLRNAYQKVGMFGMPPVPTVRAADGAFMGEQVRGFGFLHDGSIDTIARFLSTTVFSLSSEQARDVEAFVLAFDSNLAPIVGQQVTLTPTNAAAAGPRIDLLLAAGAAPVAACDVVVHGILNGVPRGWVRLPSGRFRSDRKADPELTDGDLRAQAGVAEQERTWTCVPPGGTRTAASTAMTRSPRIARRAAPIDAFQQGDERRTPSQSRARTVKRSPFHPSSTRSGRMRTTSTPSLDVSPSWSVSRPWFSIASATVRRPGAGE